MHDLYKESCITFCNPQNQVAEECNYKFLLTIMELLLYRGVVFIQDVDTNAFNVQ